MKLTHVAIWTNDLERARLFYVHHFGGKSNEKYENPKKGFASYFVTFNNGMALEIMQRTDITEPCEKDRIGLAHIAIQVSSRETVNQMIEYFRSHGYPIVGEPRLTGDGFYEGAILDPDENLVEIVSWPDTHISRALFYPYDLLLLADPDKEKVDSYLPQSECFVATSLKTTAGVIVVKKLDNDTAEIMNLAVAETHQRRGIARKLLHTITNNWAKEQNISRLIIRTGTSAPGPFIFYQQEGFDLVEVDYDYFTRNYSEPIFENGIQCRHQLIMEKRLS